MPSPYKTNCFDYNEIGCKSRVDCVYKCRTELKLYDNNISSIKYGDIFIYPNYDILTCENKYKSTGCFNEYYDMKIMTNIKNYINKIGSVIRIYASGEPDTIIAHSPQFYPINFICFIGGVISLWTGFSLYSLYGYGKWIFNRKKENKITPKKTANKKISKIIKQNNELNCKLNKVMKVVKIIRKKNQ